MPYCTESDVTAIISTTLNPSQIEAIIDESDAYINKMIGVQSISDKIIRKLSKLLTAKEIKTRQPTSLEIGEYRETHDPVAVWDAEIQRILRMYQSNKVVSTPYNHIDEDDRYKEDLRR
jgi:hypothetical protein